MQLLYIMHPLQNGVVCFNTPTLGDLCSVPHRDGTIRIPGRFSSGSRISAQISLRYGDHDERVGAVGSSSVKTAYSADLIIKEVSHHVQGNM